MLFHKQTVQDALSIYPWIGKLLNLYYSVPKCYKFHVKCQFFLYVPPFCTCVSSHSQLFGEPDVDEDVSPDTEATDGDDGDNGSGDHGEDVPMSDGLTDGVDGNDVIGVRQHTVYVGILHVIGDFCL